jgi:uncharacterized protein DUF4349
MINKRKRGISLCALLLMLVLILSGCAKGFMTEDKALQEQATSTEMQKTSDIGFSNQAPSENNADRGQTIEQTSLTENNRKIIKSARVELETLEFDKTTSAIVEKTKSIGGYVESSNISGSRISEKQSFQDRYASFNLRIPEKYFEQFMLDFNNIGNVINSENSGTDITGEYFDSEARLKSLQIQEERLIEILKKAESVKDIIELERELSDVRYQIENFTGTLRKWDNMVNFATIQVSVYEVQEIKEPKPISLIDRVGDGFSSSIKVLIKLVKELTVLIAILLPFVIIALVIFLIVKYILKKMKKNDKEI